MCIFDLIATSCVHRYQLGLTSQETWVCFSLCVSLSPITPQLNLIFFPRVKPKCVAEDKPNIYSAHLLIGTTHISSPGYFLSIFVIFCLFGKMASPESFTRFAFVRRDPPIVLLWY